MVVKGRTVVLQILYFLFIWLYGRINVLVCDLNSNDGNNLNLNTVIASWLKRETLP